MRALAYSSLSKLTLYQAQEDLDDDVGKNLSRFSLAVACIIASSGVWSSWEQTVQELDDEGW